jgi:hypothetical protein
MITRKTLNEIAKTFNNGIKASLISDDQGKWIRALAIYQTAKEMLLTMQSINPRVNEDKWEEAILKDVHFPSWMEDRSFTSWMTEWDSNERFVEKAEIGKGEM